MNINDYKDTISGIKATDSFKRRVINSLEKQITDEKTKFRKPVIIALATCLAAALIIPVLTFAVIIPAFSPSSKGALAGDTSDVESNSNTQSELNSKLEALANGAKYNDDYYKDGIVYQELPDFNAENSYIISERFKENIAGSVKIGTPKDKLESFLGKPVCNQDDLMLYAFGENFVGFYGKENVELAVVRKVKTTNYDNDILIPIVKRLANNEEIEKVYADYKEFFDYTDKRLYLRGFKAHSNNGVEIYYCRQVGETSIDIYSDFKGSKKVTSDNEYIFLNFIDKNSIAAGMVDKINNHKEINNSYTENGKVSPDKSMTMLNQFKDGSCHYLLLRYNDNSKPDKIYDDIYCTDFKWFSDKFIEYKDLVNKSKILDVTTGNIIDNDGIIDYSWNYPQYTEYISDMLKEKYSDINITGEWIEPLTLTGNRCIALFGSLKNDPHQGVVQVIITNDVLSEIKGEGTRFLSPQKHGALSFLGFGAKITTMELVDDDRNEWYFHVLNGFEITEPSGKVDKNTPRIIGDAYKWKDRYSDIRITNGYMSAQAEDGTRTAVICGSLKDDPNQGVVQVIKTNGDGSVIIKDIERYLTPKKNGALLSMWGYMTKDSVLELDLVDEAGSHQFKVLEGFKEY